MTSSVLQVPDEYFYNKFNKENGRMVENLRSSQQNKYNQES